MGLFKKIFCIQNDYQRKDCIKRKTFVLFGLKLFHKNVNREIRGLNNEISVPDNVSICVRGNNNKVIITDKNKLSSIKLYVKGDNNCFYIDDVESMESEFYVLGSNHKLKIDKSKYSITCKAQIGQVDSYDNKATGCSLEIGENCSIMGADFYLYQNGTSVVIGEDCMLSSDIVIQSNDGHIIYDKNSDKPINAENYKVEIGSHVWIGRRAYIHKKAKIPNGCIVGANAFVTKPFNQECCVIAGAPAKIIKENIDWGRSCQLK